ncbi:MAG: hypothetical protein KC620_22660 [Myxococcales bacterium]|nr:hypothetical protein [Myxococcales bacterium]
MRFSDELREMLGRVKRARVANEDRWRGEDGYLGIEEWHELTGMERALLWVADRFGLDRGDLGLPTDTPIDREPMPGERK